MLHWHFFSPLLHKCSAFAQENVIFFSFFCGPSHPYSVEGALGLDSGGQVGGGQWLQQVSSPRFGTRPSLRGAYETEGQRSSAPSPPWSGGWDRGPQAKPANRHGGGWRWETSCARSQATDRGGAVRMMDTSHWKNSSPPPGPLLFF